MTSIANSRPKRSIKVRNIFDPSVASSPLIVKAVRIESRRSMRSNKKAQKSVQIQKNQKSPNGANGRKKGKLKNVSPTIINPTSVKRSKKKEIKQPLPTPIKPTELNKKSETNIQYDQKLLLEKKNNTEKHKTETADVICIDTGTFTNPRRIIKTPLKNRASNNVKEAALFYRYSVKHKSSNRPDRNLNKIKETKSYTTSTPLLTKGNSKFIPELSVQLDRNIVDIKNNTNSCTKSLNNNATKSIAKSRIPIYKILQENGKPMQDTQPNVYDYLNNSQDSLSVDNDEYSMKNILQKLEHEKKIILKRKATVRRKKNLSQSDDHFRTKPIWADTRITMQAKRGLRELKQNLQKHLLYDKVLDKIKKRQNFSAGQEIQLALVDNQSSTKENMNVADELHQIESITNAPPNVDDNLQNSTAKHDILNEQYKSKDNLPNNDLKDVNLNDFDDYSLPAIEDTTGDDGVSIIDLSNISKKTYKCLNTINKSSTNQSVSEKTPKTYGHNQSTPLRVQSSGCDSPWRLDLSLNFQNLPSFVTGTLIDKSGVPKRTGISSINTAGETILSTSKNTSNIENMRPKHSTDNTVSSHDNDNFKILVERRRQGPRTPLKPLAFRTVQNFSLRNSNDKCQKDKTQLEIDCGSSDNIKNYFGFDDDDANEHNNNDEVILKIATISQKSKNILHNKLKDKLKSLRKYLTTPMPNKLKRVRSQNKIAKLSTISTPKITLNTTAVHTTSTKQKFDDILSIAKEKDKNEDTQNCDATDMDVDISIDDSRCSPVLFKSFWGDVENEHQNQQRTYSRIAKRKRDSISFTDTENEDDGTSKAKKTRTKTKQQNKKEHHQLEQFCHQFNSMCDSVDTYELVIE